MSESSAQQPQTIATDLSCISCGYNLRGLTAAMNCPECATLVVHSLEGFVPLRGAPPAYVRLLSGAAAVKIASCALAVGDVALVGAAEALRAGSVGSVPVWRVVGWLLTLSPAASIALALAAAWMITTRDRSVPADALRRILPQLSA